jgi:tRNA dimethylallyltransferase
VRDENLREKLRRRELRSAGSLHRILRRLDSASAADIHPNDAKKVMRALEVRLLTGASRRELRTESVGLEGYRVLKVALDPPRAELYQRLERRAVRMFEEGLLEETRALLALAPADAKPFESLGYAQAKAVVEGRMNLEDAIAETTIRTRQYAKRQWTWFRREPGIQWFSGFGDDPAVACQTAELMARFLADATSLSEE